jgi:hypothetical protein
MTLINNLKPQVDLPVWEWLRFAPTVTAAGFCTCTDESENSRYIYYLGSLTSGFYRYDTICDSWQTLAAPQIVPAAASSMRYTIYGGYRGRVIAATNTTLTIAGLAGKKFLGKTIRITEGTGIGQERVISDITNPEIVEFGTASAASVSSITDAQTIPKKWLINQWRGYQCRVVYGTGLSQVRKILYNDANILYFTDVNAQPMDHWNNTGFSTIAPYVAPAANTQYYIEKSVITVPTWTTQPDETSKFVITTGGIWLVSGRTLALGSISMQYYDIASDTWFTKTCAGGQVGTVLSSDISIERCGEIAGIFDSGFCDNSTAKTLVDSTKNWITDQWVNYSVKVKRVSTETIQTSTVIGNTATTLYIDDTSWETIPNDGPNLDDPYDPFTYTIMGNANNIWVSGNANAAIFKYLINEDLWTDAWHYDSGVACNMSARYGKQSPYSVTAVAGTACLTSVVLNGAGTGYRIGDILTVTGGAGKVKITSTTPTTGAVLALELYATGVSGYTTGNAKTTASTIPASGGGTGCTVNIDAGQAARFTTPIRHNLKVGDVIIIAGASITAWNIPLTISHVDSLTTFDVLTIPNTIAPVAKVSQTANLLVDASKNWIIDEYKGQLVTVYILGAAPILLTGSTVKITSNTATTLVIPAVTLPVTGTCRYVIKDQACFGADISDRVPSRNPRGWATSGSTTTLEDNTKSWIPGQWVGVSPSTGHKFRIICGTGYDKGEIVITANTATTLTFADRVSWAPDTTSKYEIEDTHGNVTSFASTTTLTDTTKNWIVNQWVGKAVRINAGANNHTEALITANLATTLTVALGINTTAATCYTILGAPQRGAGIQVMWNYGQTGTDKGKYLYVPRGGAANAIDRYNLSTNRWDYCILLTPQAETHTAGTQWCYDNGNYIYFCPSSATCSRIFRIDLSTLNVDGSGQTPYAHGAAVQGNKMEIITTEDNLKFLYILRQTGAEFWRSLIYW